MKHSLDGEGRRGGSKTAVAVAGPLFILRENANGELNHHRPKENQQDKDMSGV